nr:unnamed protein product [Digitaria exilis]
MPAGSSPAPQQGSNQHARLHLQKSRTTKPAEAWPLAVVRRGLGLSASRARGTRHLPAAAVAVPCRLAASAWGWSAVAALRLGAGRGARLAAGRRAGPRLAAGVRLA